MTASVTVTPTSAPRPPRGGRLKIVKIPSTRQRKKRRGEKTLSTSPTCSGRHEQPRESTAPRKVASSFAAEKAARAYVGKRYTRRGPFNRITYWDSAAWILHRAALCRHFLCFQDFESKDLGPSLAVDHVPDDECQAFFSSRGGQGKHFKKHAPYPKALKCYSCGKPGHFAKEGTAPMCKGLCFECGQPGDQAKNCTRKGTSTHYANDHTHAEALWCGVVISEEAVEEEETPSAPEDVLARTDVQPSITPDRPRRSHNDLYELHRARESLRLMAVATIAQAAAAEYSGNRNARASDSSRQTAKYKDKVPPMPYGLNPAALPFTPHTYVQSLRKRRLPTLSQRSPSELASIRRVLSRLA